MAELSQKTIQNIKQLVDKATNDPYKDIPGAAVTIVNKKGKVLLNYVKGKAGLDKGRGLLKDNSIYWLASCTKIASTILALIAVEEGKLSLDDPKSIAKYCPELRNTPIIKNVSPDGAIELVPKKNKITLRMLLTHTSGFTYAHLNKNILKYSNLFGMGEVDKADGFDPGLLQPLIFEPGTDWSYGIGIDWACNAVARAYNSTLEDLMQEKVFKPLGITDNSFLPNKSMKERIITMSTRLKDGSLEPLPRNAVKALNENPKIAAASQQYGGSGLYSRPLEFSKLLVALLNNGVSPHTGRRILSKEMVKEMFTNQIPDSPNFGREHPMVSYVPSLSNSLPQLYAQRGNPPQGWGLSFFLNLVPTDTGKSKYSAFWCGISNTYYWIDKEAGIVGLVFTQILPFGDRKVAKLWVDVETEIYKGIVKEGSSKL